jgi:hypothetical protein
MQPLSNYRSDDGVYSATVCLHRNRYVVKTSTGLTKDFGIEAHAENWADDFIYKCNLKLQQDEEKIILKPARGLFDSKGE